jgi:hypothetical protein
MTTVEQPQHDYDVHITETEWWDDLLDGIFGPRQGGARIIVDAEGASTGVGKTGLAVYVARLLARVFDYELRPEDMTLSGQHYLNRWRDHPGKGQPSVLILDELGGAGAGHARRAMSQQNVDLGNAWQLMRKKRIVSLVTLPHWSKVDKDMRQQADFRLWCRKKPIGYFEPYQIGAGFDRGNVKTHGYDGVDRVRFPDLTAQDDPLYEYLASQKDDLLESGFFDADKLEESDEDDDSEDSDNYHRDDVICMLYESGEFTQRELAEQFDLSRQRIGQIIRN